MKVQGALGIDVKPCVSLCEVLEAFMDSNRSSWSKRFSYSQWTKATDEAIADVLHESFLVRLPLRISYRPNQALRSASTSQRNAPDL